MKSRKLIIFIGLVSGVWLSAFSITLYAAATQEIPSTVYVPQTYCSSCSYSSGKLVNFIRTRGASGAAYDVYQLDYQSGSGYTLRHSSCTHIACTPTYVPPTITCSTDKTVPTGPYVNAADSSQSFPSPPPTKYFWIDTTANPIACTVYGYNTKPTPPHPPPPHIKPPSDLLYGSGLCTDSIPPCYLTTDADWKTNKSFAITCLGGTDWVTNTFTFSVTKEKSQITRTAQQGKRKDNWNCGTSWSNYQVCPGQSPPSSDKTFYWLAGKAKSDGVIYLYNGCAVVHAVKPPPPVKRYACYQKYRPKVASFCVLPAGITIPPDSCPWVGEQSDCPSGSSYYTTETCFSPHYMQTNINKITTLYPQHATDLPDLCQ